MLALFSKLFDVFLKLCELWIFNEKENYAAGRWGHPRCKRTRGRFRPFGPTQTDG
jgi:hypothetical protein